MEQKVIKSRLADLRKRERRTQEEFAEEIGVHSNTVSSVENSHSYLKIETGIDIAVKYGVSLDWLYGLSDANEIGILDSFISFFELEEYPLHVFNKGDTEKRPFFKMRLSEVARDYLIKRNEIEKFRREKELPDEAYNAWIKEIKSIYSEKLKITGETGTTEYVLIENGDKFGDQVAYAKARYDLSDPNDKRELDRLNFDM